MSARTLLIGRVISTYRRYLRELGIGVTPKIKLAVTPDEVEGIMKESGPLIGYYGKRADVVFVSPTLIIAEDCIPCHTFMHELKHFIDAHRMGKEEFDERYVEEVRKHGYFHAILEINASRFSEEECMKPEVGIPIDYLSVATVAETIDGDTALKFIKVFTKHPRAHKVGPLSLLDRLLYNLSSYVTAFYTADREVVERYMTREEREVCDKAFRKFTRKLLEVSKDTRIPKEIRRLMEDNYLIITGMVEQLR